ncbi:acyl-CoA dehydrogenase family protein [Maricaulis parjimensis]|uniref:acyl-CoA dehydrogenase family protein n=1 Tax=Maricaulis parjimensis TaxID=144023 RepID=UPI00193A8A32|nr:acyl-CoA dehydrogenase family protein [Maricaulis parjimensis]
MPLNLDWSPEEKAFQAEVRQFIADHLTDDIRRAGQLRTSVYTDHEASMEWQKILHARGWAAPAWPKEYGGTGWSVAQKYIFSREMSAAGAPALSPMGISMVAHAIIAFGTPEQKAHFLPRILTGEDFWCQGYSEPGAGSDLASLQMSAVRDGDDYILNGSKIWTTHATEANWIFCLVRTDNSGKKQQGITFLLIPMDLAGIDVRPIVMSSGERVQNQVFFDDVRAPAENILGEENKGWTVAKYLLEFERGGAAYAPDLQGRLDVIERQAAAKTNDDGVPLLDDPDFSARLADARIRTDVLEVLEWKIMARLTAGQSVGSSASMMKILGTELSQAVSALAMDLSGPLSMPYQPHAGRPGAPVEFFTPPADGHVTGSPNDAIAPLLYFNDRAGSIYAGSNEIQRNILAKAELGL